MLFFGGTPEEKSFLFSGPGSESFLFSGTSSTIGNYLKQRSDTRSTPVYYSPLPRPVLVVYINLAFPPFPRTLPSSLLLFSRSLHAFSSLLLENLYFLFFLCCLAATPPSPPSPSSSSSSTRRHGAAPAPFQPNQVSCLRSCPCPRPDYRQSER